MYVLLQLKKSLAELIQMKHGTSLAKLFFLTQTVLGSPQTTYSAVCILCVVVFQSDFCITVVLFLLSSFQVAVSLRTVNVVTMGHGALGMTSLLVADTVRSVGLAGLAEIA